MNGYKVGEEHPAAGIPLYRLNPGDVVAVAGLDGIFTVESTDSALVTLSLSNGSTLRVGWRNIREANNAT